MKSFNKASVKTAVALKLFVTALIAFNYAFGAELSNNQEESLDWEQQDNAVAPNRTMEVDLEHYEIPLEVLELNIAQNRLPKSIYSELIFKKKVDGVEKDFVRWIINPEDTKYVEIVGAYLKGRGLDSTKYKYFKAFQTASRSWYCLGPKSKKLFSLKVSTNKTGGNWQDKGQTYSDALDVRTITDHVKKAMKANPPQYFKFMDEPVAFGIKDLDQAMVLRLLAGVASSKTRFRYLPAFSALNEEEGKRIALKNGANPNDIAGYWNQHLNIPLAKALAELFVMAGITLDSPHGQNFIVELDTNDVPTGKIILKDLGDAYLSTEHFTATDNQSIIKSFSEPHNIMSGRMPLAIGLLHGNKQPSWMGTADYVKFGNSFFQAFAETAQQMTGIPKEDLIGSPQIDGGNFSYHQTMINTSKESFKTFFAKLMETKTYVASKFRTVSKQKNL